MTPGGPPRPLTALGRSLRALAWSLRAPARARVLARAAVVVVPAAVVLAAPAPTGAQAPGAPPAPPAQARPAAPGPSSVPSTHWAYPLLDRMAADGLLDGVWLPGRRPAGARAVAAALDTAVARSDGSPWSATASAAREWLYAEYGTPEGRFRVLPTAGARASDGPRTDPDGGLVGAEVRYRPVGPVALWAEPIVEAGTNGLEMPLPRLGAAWRVGAFRLAVAHEARRLGPGASGGIVLDDAARLGWLHVELAEPVVLPWLLRYLGPFQLSGSASRIGADSLGPSVGFFAGEIRFQPHPRVTLGLYRSAVVAGEVDGERPDFGDLFKILFDSGRTMPNFEDQKLSFSGSVRADLLGVRMVPYFVWGIEDTWEIDRDPGTVLGAWLPALPVGGRPVGVRYEYTAFGDDARIIWPWARSWEWRNWYRHGNGRRLYVDGDGHLLGHPLGGYGSEHRVELDVPLPVRGVLLRATGFTRVREQGTYQDPDDPFTGPYSNILYDELPGRSRGARLGAVLSTKRLRLRGDVSVEVGAEDWSRVAGSIRATWVLPGF